MKPRIDICHISIENGLDKTVHENSGVRYKLCLIKIQKVCILKIIKDCTMYKGNG